jgi:hypothetical protein
VHGYQELRSRCIIKHVKYTYFQNVDNFELTMQKKPTISNTLSTVMDISYLVNIYLKVETSYLYNSKTDLEWNNHLQVISIFSIFI